MPRQRLPWIPLLSPGLFEDLPAVVITPAHPKVEPEETIRPKAIYAVGADDVKRSSRYEKIWKEIFQPRGGKRGCGDTNLGRRLKSAFP